MIWERGVNQTARLLADALSLTGSARAEFEAVAAGRLPGSGRPAAVAAGGGAAATRMLPRDVAAFTGRERELGRLLEVADEPAGSGGAVTIYAIGGMAGIGKTAFAVHAAHLLSGRFPDGQIFLPLHGHVPGQRPAEPAQALASLLVTAGVAAAQIPRGLDARSRLWRDYAAGRRLLLVLDDAVGHEQVRLLLPGSAGCLVLVTSRRRLTALQDARSISLDALTPGESADLLVRLADRPDIDVTDAAVAQITQLGGRLPLAVSLLGSQLRQHTAWSCASLVADLAEARDKLELMHAENISVSVALDLSYRDLTPAQQQFFRRLALRGLAARRTRTATTPKRR